MPKQYTLITGEPLTEFEESVLRMLHDVAEAGCSPRAMCGVILTESGETITCYHKAELSDMMIARGYLDLDIVNDNILGNLPWFIEQAQREYLSAEFDDEVEEGNEDE